MNHSTIRLVVRKLEGELIDDDQISERNREIDTRSRSRSHVEREKIILALRKHF